MPSVPVGSDPESYGAKLRAKGVQIGAGVATTVRRGTPESNSRYNGWERGLAGENRPGGTFMPYLDAKGDVIRNKANASGEFDKAKDNLARQRARAT